MYKSKKKITTGFVAQSHICSVIWTVTETSCLSDNRKLHMKKLYCKSKNEKTNYNTKGSELCSNKRGRKVV